MHRIGILLAWVSTLVYGQGDFKPVRNVVEFKKQFEVESKKIASIRSDFQQEKDLTMLTEKIISKGEFRFKRSDKVRIEYKTPYSYIMILNGNQMISKDGNRESRVNVSSNKMFRQINRIIIDCVQGNILNNSDFDSKISENLTLYSVELTPKTKLLKQFFKKILVLIEKKDYSVSFIELTEQEGDRTTMKFSNKQFNQPISDEVFALH